MNPRANYSVKRYRDVLVVYDLGGPYPSVTNDAELVCADLVREHGLEPATRVIYRDSDGRFDELVVNDQGHFCGFMPLGDHNLADALAKVQR